MINILEILKKIPNLEDMVFYSPLYGDVKVRVINNSSYPIEIQQSFKLYEGLNQYGQISNNAIEGECMLYPSRQNRDWSTFKVLRKDLPKGTNVMVSNNKNVWGLREYKKDGKCYLQSEEPILSGDWKYIISVDKFNFDTWTFKEKDNYGTTYKE